MSFSTTTNKKFFDGDGATLAFPVTEYVVYKDTHVEVTVDSVVQTLVTDYTVAINTPLPGSSRTMRVLCGIRAIMVAPLAPLGMRCWTTLTISTSAR